MRVENIKEIIHSQAGDIAFIIGNGINRYRNNPGTLSWDALLKSLWTTVTKDPIEKIPQGISLTEFYDILDIENLQNIDIQAEVAKLMQNWQPAGHHRTILQKIRELNVPVLTTNFESDFAQTYGFGLQKMKQDSFTDFYPWGVYYSDSQLNSPTDGFGIWHINGTSHYRRSIRLGLSHYMGSVGKARNLIHQKGKNSLFSKKDNSLWEGHKTWLHIIFNKSLFIFGLGLEENEVFLRWLLIERRKYFKKFPERGKHQGWYIKTGNGCTDDGKKLFLEKIGFEVIEINDYDDLYLNLWK